jgi:hypothetical protein
LTGQPATAHYSAPEIFEAADYDEKVDGFSFGSVLYEIITRKPVFPRKLARLRVMIKLIALQLPEPPEDWTPTLADLLRRCWRVNPALRPTFDDIDLFLREVKFAILPGFGPDVVLDFVQKVESQH